MQRQVYAKVTGAALSLLVAATAARADNLERRVRIASEVVGDRQSSDEPIPNWVLEHAQCIASLRVLKIGIIWGGEGSTGLVSCRTPGGWSAPSFFNVGGVNFGLQIGVQLIDSVLLFITDSSRQALDHASFQIGADASFAAGPIGGGAGVGVMPHADLLNYQRTVGLYVGATVDGFILTHGPMRNHEVYGDSYDPPAILAMPGVQAPMVVQPFVQILNRYVPAH